MIQDESTNGSELTQMADWIFVVVATIRDLHGYLKNLRRALMRANGNRTKQDSIHADLLSGEKWLQDQQNDLARLVNDYAEKRRQLFTDRISGNFWCSKCGGLFSLSEGEHSLFMIERREKKIVDGGSVVYTTTKEVHRACPDCRGILLMRHGWHGPIDREAIDQEYFLACVMNEDYNRILKFGVWEFIREWDKQTRCHNEILPPSLVEEHEQKYEIIPPIIALDKTGYGATVHCFQKDEIEDDGRLELRFG